MTNAENTPLTHSSPDRHAFAKAAPTENAA